MVILTCKLITTKNLVKVEFKMSLYSSYKKEKISGDVNVLKQLREIVGTGYEISTSWGLDVRSLKGIRFASVQIVNTKATVLTVSSHWTVEQATVMLKQMQEATQMAAEINLFLKDLDHQYKEDFERSEYNNKLK